MNGVAPWMVLTLALVCPTACVQAQTFPTGPIQIVVPLAPGDAADISARAMGEEISRAQHAGARRQSSRRQRNHWRE